MRSTISNVVVRLLQFVFVIAFFQAALSDQPPTEQQSLAMAEASGMGTALGAGQRCGMPADDLSKMRKLALERLQSLAPDQQSFEQATGAMEKSERYGATEMPDPQGGCAALLMVTSGLLGKLAFIVTHADLEVPDLHRSSSLENFAAWAGQLAVMASHCGARDQVVNKAAALSAEYIIQQAPNRRARRRAEAELSEMMLQAELEDLGDRRKCKEILTTFGSFFGNLDSRLQQ